MLAKRLPSILPNMTFDEMMEVTKIYSILGLTSNDRPIITKRPFRSPHHTITPVSLIGGGTKPKPRRNKFGAFGSPVFRWIARI